MTNADNQSFAFPGWRRPPPSAPADDLAALQIEIAKAQLAQIRSETRHANVLQCVVIIWPWINSSFDKLRHHLATSAWNWSTCQPARSTRSIGLTIRCTGSSAAASSCTGTPSSSVSIDLKESFHTFRVGLAFDLSGFWPGPY